MDGIFDETRTLPTSHRSCQLSWGRLNSSSTVCCRLLTNGWLEYLGCRSSEDGAWSTATERDAKWCLKARFERARGHLIAPPPPSILELTRPMIG